MNKGPLLILSLATGLFFSASRSSALDLIGGLLDPLLSPILNLLNIDLGSDVEFRATPAPGVNPIGYQWLLNGVPLVGETNSILRINNVAIEDGGSYDVVVVETNRATRSAPGLLTLNLLNLNFSDNFFNLLQLPNSSRNGTGRGSNRNATRQAGEPIHGKKGHHSLWFKWRATASGVATFRTAGRTFDTLLAAYVGNDIDALQLVSKDVLDDDEGGYHTSVITFNAVNGTTYRIAIDGLGDQSGDIVLNWNLNTSVPPVGTIEESPTSKTLFAGIAHTLESDYSGSSINCEWLFNGVRTGVDDKDFSIANLTPAFVGRYTMVMRNSAGVENSTLPVDIQISTDANNVDPRNVQAMNKFYEVHELAERYRTNSSQRSSMRSRVPVTTPATGYRGTQIFNTAGATKDPGEPMICNVLGGASEWFSYYATNNGILHLNTDGSSFDTVLGVYTDPTYQGTFASLVEMGCDNNGGVDARDSRIRLPVSAGTLYYVAIDGVNAATGIAYLNYNLGNPPTLLQGPVSKTVIQGQSATFEAQAGGSTNLHFFWYRNGVLLTNELIGSFSIPAAQLSHAGNYQLVVSNHVDSITSAVVSLTVQVPATITAQPAPASVVVGGSANFSVTAQGTGSLSYQWFHGANPIAGATSSTLSLTNIQVANAGSYRVVVTNVAGQATSDSVLLTVNVPASISGHPIGTNVLEGTTVNLVVTAAGTAPFQYQWRRNGLQIAGATNSVLNLASISPSQQGNYAAVVWNNFGSITSLTAVVEVEALVPPAILTQPVGGSRLAGSNITFTASATSTYPISYQWFHGASPITGATASSLTLSNLQAANAGAYRVSASNSLGQVLSDTATLVIQFPPSISLQPLGTNLLEGGNAQLLVEAAGTGPLHYQWRRNGTALTSATNALFSIHSIQVSDQGSYDVVVWSDFGSITSLTAVVEVEALVPPAILTQPVGGSRLAGSNMIFTASATSTYPISYQWFHGASPIAGATASSLTLSNLQTANAGSYRVSASNQLGQVLSEIAILELLYPPAITTHPGNIQTLAGSTVGLMVEATGTGPLCYQWRRDGVALPGKTNASINIQSIQTTQQGIYDAVVWNSFGSITSLTAEVEVEALVPPTIHSHPVSGGRLVGSNMTFTASATSTYLISYQWFQGASPIAGATASSLTLSNLQAANAGSYRVSASNSLGQALSDTATLVIQFPPFITLQPVGTNLLEGGNVQLLVEAAGTGPLHYQWRRNGTALTSATNALFSIHSVLVDDQDGYDVVVWSDFGSVTSLTAVVEVEALVPPAILTQPVGGSRLVGSNMTFTASATSTYPISYQWFHGASPITGATASSLTLSNLQAANAGAYRVSASNSLGQVLSDTATLVIQFPPSITLQPLGTNLLEGGNVQLLVEATGTGPLHYQWRRNGTALTSATNALFSIHSVQVSDQGSYDVVVWSDFGSVTSLAAVVAVEALVAPAISSQPVGGSRLAGSNITFTASATSTYPISYQWFHGASPIAGATASSLTLSNLQAANAGAYRVSASNSLGQVLSDTATLVIQFPPSISLQPLGTNLLEGGNAQLLVEAAGTGPLHYQWRRNGTALTSATNALFSIHSVQVSDQGSYDVVVWSDFGSVTSLTAVVEVEALVPPSILTHPVGGSRLAGSNITFTASATSTYPISYQWFHGASPIAGATASSLTLSNLQTANAGSYHVSASNSLGQALSDTATLVIQFPPSITLQPLGTNLLEGGNAQLLVEAAGTGPLHYQWRRNGAALTSATNALFSIHSVQVSDQGSYEVVVGNDFGSITSLVAVIEVQTPETAGISIHPQSQTAAPGSSVVLSVAPSGTGPFAFQWFKGTNAIAGATSENLVITGFAAEHEGCYRVTVANALGQVGSQSAEIYLNSPLRIVTFGKDSSGSRLRLIGVRNTTYHLEASGLSMQWSPLFTTNSPSGIVDWTEASTGGDIRFYRARAD